MTPAWDDLLVVGRIARPHGLRGQVVIDPETDFPEERFAPGGVVFIAAQGAARPLEIETVRFQKGRPIVAFAGVGTIDAAEALGRGEVRAPAKPREARPPGTHYQHELQGCRVVRRGGGVLGEVRRVERTGAADLLAVDANGREVLVPFVPEICVEVDAEARVIVVELPDGLVELNG